MSVKISELPAATVINDADLLCIVQGSETKKAAVSLLPQPTIPEVQAFTTGMGMLWFGNTPAPLGWLLMDDGYVGSASSSANHADASLQNLFVHLWTHYSDVYCTVSGGRGASALADWQANKKIRLPLTCGRSPLGAGTGAGLTARTLGATGGEEAHALTANENGQHDHAIPGHISAYASGGIGAMNATTPDSEKTTSSGLGTPHGTMHPFLVINFIIKV